MKPLTIAIAALILTGCTQVPKTHIYVKIPEMLLADGRILKGGSVLVKAPKNSTITGFEANRSLTNVSVKFEKYEAKMDPDVISASTEQIRAHYAGASEVAAKAIAAGAKGVNPVP